MQRFPACILDIAALNADPTLALQKWNHIPWNYPYLVVHAESIHMCTCTPTHTHTHTPTHAHTQPRETHALKRWNRSMEERKAQQEHLAGTYVCGCPPLLTRMWLGTVLACEPDHDRPCPSTGYPSPIWSLIHLLDLVFIFIVHVLSDTWHTCFEPYFPRCNPGSTHLRRWVT